MSDALSSIMVDIRSTYKDTNDPDYSEIMRRFNIGLDYKEIYKIAYSFWIKDTTDQNDEYCFSFLLRKDSFNFRLELSVVGPYATLMEVGGGRCVVLDEASVKSNRDLFHTFQDLICKRSLLGETTLEIDIPFNNGSGEGNGRAAVYHALFASTETLPWRSCQSERMSEMPN